MDDSSSSPTLGAVTELPKEINAGNAVVFGGAGCPQSIPAYGYLVLCKGTNAFVYSPTLPRAGYTANCGFGFGIGSAGAALLYYYTDYTTILNILEYL